MPVERGPQGWTGGADQRLTNMKPTAALAERHGPLDWAHALRTGYIAAPRG